ncbi:MAG: DUF2125 domain-containing protein [Pseudomonadota bacterium]
MLPTLVVLGVGIVWSIAWFVAARMIEPRIEAALARQSGDVTLTCGTGDLGGYPFRFAYDCTDAAIATRAMTARMPRLVFTVQAYDPRHLIAQAQGPGTLEVDGRTIDASWNQLLASGRTTWGALRTLAETRRADPLDAITELGLGATNLSLEEAGTALTIVQANAFARPAPTAVGRDVEIAVDLTDVSDPRLTTMPIDASLRARLFSLPDDLSGDLARRWLGEEGAIGITRLDILPGDAALRLAGRVEAEENGAPTGTLTLTAAQPRAVASVLADRTLATLAATLSNALLLTGRATEIDGRDALAVDVTIENGDARLGFVPLGALPPLFQ